MDASNAERRRIAATLHDGPVQDLAATSFVVSGAAARAGVAAGQHSRASCARSPPRCGPASGRCARCWSTSTRRASPRPVCRVALTDLAQSVHAPGLEVTVEPDPDERPRTRPGPGATGLPGGPGDVAQRRAARGALHRPGHAVPPTPDATVLEVADDGPGSSPGHVGRSRGGSLRTAAAGRPARPVAPTCRSRRLRARHPLAAARRRHIVRRRTSSRTGDDPRARRRRPPAGAGWAVEPALHRRRREVVGQAATARRRWSRSPRSQPDVVLMDLSMPGIDGVEATRRDAAAPSGDGGCSGAHLVRRPDAGGRRARRRRRRLPAQGLRAGRSCSRIGAAARRAPVHVRRPAGRRALLAPTTRPPARGRTQPAGAEVLGLVAPGYGEQADRAPAGDQRAHRQGAPGHVFRPIGVADRTSAALWARDHLDKSSS